MKTAGIVLAGGKSLRMGEDKALLRWQGRPLIERQLRLLQSLKLDEAFIAGTHPGYPHIPDTKPFSGPLSALAHMMRRFAIDTRVVVVPVDMPLLEAPHLQRLLNHPSPLVAYRSHPLPLAFTVLPETARLFASRIEQNQLSLKGLWDAVTNAAWIEEEGPFLVNTNTPTEWQELITQQEVPV